MREAFEKVEQTEIMFGGDIKYSIDSNEYYCSKSYCIKDTHYLNQRWVGWQACEARAPVVPDILFDGYAVWEALPNRDAVHRKYVSDILDTIVRLLKESKS